MDKKETNKIMTRTALAVGLCIGTIHPSANAVEDYLPYIGPRPVNKTCAYQPVYVDEEKTQEIEILFDYDCTTAFVKPRSLNYEIVGQIEFYENSCGLYHYLREAQANLSLEITKLTLKNKKSPQDLESLAEAEENQTYITEEKAKLEERLSDPKIPGARFNLSVDHKIWNSDLERFRRANTLFNFEVRKQEIVHGSIQVVSIDEIATKDRSNIDLMAAKERTDAQSIGKLLVVGKPINSSYVDYLSKTYNIRNTFDENSYMFGDNVTILGQLTGFGACLLDRDGDMRLTDADLKGGQTASLGNQIAFAYTFYTPYRTGIVYQASIQDTTKFAEAIRNFQRENPHYVDHGKFQKMINALGTSVVKYSTYSGRPGIEITPQIHEEIGKLAKYELSEMLLARIADLSATRAVATNEVIQQEYKVKVCTLRVHFFSGNVCLREGWVSRWRPIPVNDYDAIIEDVKKIIDDNSSLEATILLRDSMLTTVGSKFTELNYQKKMRACNEIILYHPTRPIA